MLGNLLGNKPQPLNTSNLPADTSISPNVFNQVNLDPNVVDFRGMFHNSLPGTARSYLPAANANALNAVLTGSDAEVVDLRGAARTSVDLPDFYLSPHRLEIPLHAVDANRDAVDE
jgi:hypothetical protein